MPGRAQRGPRASRVQPRAQLLLLAELPSLPGALPLARAAAWPRANCTPEPGAAARPAHLDRFVLKGQVLVHGHHCRVRHFGRSLGESSLSRRPRTAAGAERLETHPDGSPASARGAGPPRIAGLGGLGLCRNA